MNFTVYRSSAGSGKTFTLVKEYLRIVLQDPKRFRSILAITFTNKAAAEMKERVLTSLRDLSDPSPANPSAVHLNMLPQLVEETQLHADEIALRAAGTLTRILHNYSDFAVTTIDSFMHRVIRSFAFDLHLPANFEVEIDELPLLAKCVDLLVSKAGTDDSLTKTLLAFTQSKADDEKNFNIEGDILKMATSVLKEDTRYHLARLSRLSLEQVMEIMKTLTESCRNFEQEVSNKAAAAVDIINNNHIDYACFHQGNRGIVKYFNDLSEGHIEKLHHNSYVTDTIQNGKWAGSKCPENEKNLIESISGELENIYRELETLKDSGYANYAIYRIIRNNLYPLALLNEVNKELSDIKASEDIVLISEFNKLIADIVTEEPVPFIYERLGVKFKHFLIDEFQDTSILQWHNILPLVENGLSEDRFSMVVGDGKQAIYRWRNGEVEQFARLPEIYKKPAPEFFDDREQALKRNYSEKNLGKNFRSAPGIVEFNNRFFRFLSESLSPEYQPVYTGLEQQASRTNPAGYVQVEFLPEIEDISLYHPERILQIIQNLKQDGYAYADIAILTRNNNKASLTARHLLRQGIPVLSAESLMLHGTPEIHFMLAFLRFLSWPDDAIAQAEMLRFLSYRREPGMDNLHALLQELQQYPDQSGRRFLKILHSSGYAVYPDSLARKDLYDLCEEIIRIFGLFDPPGPYMLFFLDAVAEYKSGHTADIRGFLDWWEEEKGRRSIVVPEGVDAVRVMTIHKSKGLEFPVVIFPFADIKQRATLDQIWAEFKDDRLPGLHSILLPTTGALEETVFGHLYDEETAKSLLDFINMAYVAMTRPTDRLYVLSGKPSKNPANMKSLSDVFCHYFGSLAIYNNDQHSYTFGKEEINPRRKASATTGGHAPDVLVTSAWQHRLRLSLQSGLIWGPGSAQEKRIWGNIVHAALSVIRDPEDIGKAVSELTQAGIIDAGSREKLTTTLKSITEHPVLKPYFHTSGQVLNEADILTPDGNSYRPDRIVFQDNETAVIDYKTGQPSDADRSQINHYGSLLLDMNYQNIRKLLVYIDDEIHVETW